MHNYQSFVGQILGKRNIFGYSKTIMNQVSMVCWFLGDFYSSKIFDRYITRFWIAFNIVAIFLLFLHSFAYIMFSTNLDVSKMLFASQVIIAITYLHITTPLSSYLYRDEIAKTFEVLDRVDEYEIHARYVTAEMRKSNLNVAYTVLLTQMTLFTLYLTFTYLHLVIGYNVNKLSDPNYFIYPLYCENVDQLGTFVVLQISQMISAMPVGPMYFLIPFFPIIITKEFYCKFQALRDSMTYRSKVFERRYEAYMSSAFASSEEMLKLEESFVRHIHSYAKHHRDLLRAIRNLRSYLEFNMSTNLFSFLYVEILLIHIITLIEQEPILLKMRITANVALFGTIQLVYCFIGKLFSDMGEMIQDTVYDIPWYYITPPGRKAVQLLLYQAQVTIQFKAFRIYPLNMGFFLRSCNNVYSMVNLLRRRTPR